MIDVLWAQRRYADNFARTEDRFPVVQRLLARAYAGERGPGGEGDPLVLVARVIREAAAAEGPLHGQTSESPAAAGRGGSEPARAMTDRPVRRAVRTGGVVDLEPARQRHERLNMRTGDPSLLAVLLARSTGSPQSGAPAAACPVEFPRDALAAGRSGAIHERLAPASVARTAFGQGDAEQPFVAASAGNEAAGASPPVGPARAGDPLRDAPGGRPVGAPALRGGAARTRHSLSGAGGQSPEPALVRPAPAGRDETPRVDRQAEPSLRSLSSQRAAPAEVARALPLHDAGGGRVPADGTAPGVVSRLGRARDAAAPGGDRDRGNVPAIDEASRAAVVLGETQDDRGHWRPLRPLADGPDHGPGRRAVEPEAGPDPAHGEAGRVAAGRRGDPLTSTPPDLRAVPASPGDALPGPATLRLRRPTLAEASGAAQTGWARSPQGGIGSREPAPGSGQPVVDGAAPGPVGLPHGPTSGPRASANPRGSIRGAPAPGTPTGTPTGGSRGSTFEARTPLPTALLARSSAARGGSVAERSPGGPTESLAVLRPSDPDVVARLPFATGERLAGLPESAGRAMSTAIPPASPARGNGMAQPEALRGGAVDGDPGESPRAATLRRANPPPIPAGPAPRGRPDGRNGVASAGFAGGPSGKAQGVEQGAGSGDHGLVWRSQAAAAPGVSGANTDGFRTGGAQSRVISAGVARATAGEPPAPVDRASEPVAAGETPATAAIDWDRLVSEVSRRLRRQLTIERERRGLRGWN